MIIVTLLPLFEFTHRVKALLHVYTYTDVGGRAAQDAYRDIGGRAMQEAKAEQLPSSPVCPPGYVKKLTKGAAISSFFHYANQANRTTLHAVQLRILGS